ncbi:MAG TPA: FG-GAP-like repeat-containing protein [Saprospiraceae bacterium]|nr:FG-GAP-like repeat-containing protein [Saprospiraceae bacterium]HMQ82112.1 FG-GAP-like repeat-containing protein [Saprospiraceae bacterium]
MRNIYYLPLILGLGIYNLEAQVSFTRITEGAIVNTPSDSRSCNFVDVNNDGFDDIFISNGPSGGENNMLYLSFGNGTFSDSQGGAIITDNSASDGATFADADNDGDLDAFVVTWYGQPNYFYTNDGNGQFTLQPLTNALTYSETASWGDYDNDGLVDLYISNSNATSPNLLRNLLYKNLGNGAWMPITTGAWVQDAHISRSINWTDFDSDGDIDLFVSNEENQKNDLYRNDGTGFFTAVTDNLIVADGKSSTGSSWADVDNDGDLDLFVANYNQHNQLFINDGMGNFSATVGQPIVQDGGSSFGSVFGDIDNDGDLDLFVVNGFGPSSGVENFLYLNDGTGHFTRDLESISELETQCSYGAAFGDMDNDGFLDLAVANCKTTGQVKVANTLFHNSGNSNKWIKIRLQGTLSNRSAIGAKIRLKATINGAERWQMREISAQDGYNCQNSLQVHFGLGDASQADSLIVEWPSGQMQNLPAILSNQTIDLTEPISATIPGANPWLDYWHISPNPADEIIQIKGRLNAVPDSLALILMDHHGRVLRRHNFSNMHQTLNLDWPIADLPAGQYYVMLQKSWSEQQTKTFIIAR